MLSLTQAKELIKDLDRSGLEDLIEQHGEDVIEAALNLDIQPGDIAEAYQGEWRSDEAFVQNLLEDTGTMPKDLPNYVHIDWESTARDVMMDYCEDNGHYFRNL